MVRGAWSRRRPCFAAVLAMGLVMRIPQSSCFLARNSLWRRVSLSTRLFVGSSQDINKNPTLDWKGSSHTTSSFASHVLIAPEEAPVAVVDVVDRVLRDHRTLEASPTTDLSAAALIHLGSVWFLPASAPRDPAFGIKPVRLTAEDASKVLENGDYLRIHHDPRRFPAVHEYDWGCRRFSIGNDGGENRGVIVAEDADKGWLVVDKPAGVPVHMTVDNAQENIASCLLAAAMQKQQQTITEQPDIYVATPQRLDQNTSGLLVVATSKNFAAYFAQLLRFKTAKLLEKNTNQDESIGGIHKLYRCLVCLMPPPAGDVLTSSSSSWSVNAAAAELQSYVLTGKVMRHYLEPSIRAPKRFVLERPTERTDDWPESLLKIRKASPVYALAGNEAGINLARSLWKNSTNSIESSSSMPVNCQAVMELEIELLTGRTHQIRGQFAACYYPLVGDAQYGGAQAFCDQERLALQCCDLEFLDPDVIAKHDGTTNMTRSQRWNRFQLKTAWWTPLLEKYERESKAMAPEQATTSTMDVETASTATSTRKRPRPELLPPRVSLSPGKNKYVLVRAAHPATPEQIEWFVKSAAPSECGGPYHGKWRY